MLAMAPRAVTVIRQVTASKPKQGRALVSRAWDRATANKRRVVMDRKGVGMVSKGLGAMEGKQAAGVLELGVIRVTGRTRLLQGKTFNQMLLWKISLSQHEHDTCCT